MQAWTAAIAVCASWPAAETFSTSWPAAVNNAVEQSLAQSLITRAYVEFSIIYTKWLRVKTGTLTYTNAQWVK